jgi:hypothetical protein
MPTLAQLAVRSWERHKERKAQEERMKNPLDKDDLPFGLHDDGLIELSPLIPPGMIMPRLGKSHVIYASSRFKFMEKQGFRVLLHSEEDVEKISYLWITQDVQGFSVRWFARLDTVYPPDSAGWDFWTNKDEGAIGWKDFSTQEGVAFPRLWPQGGPDRVSPVQFTELIHQDRYDPTKSFSVKHDLMLYGRSAPVVPARDEFIILSSVEEPDGSSVTIDVGVDISSADLKVRY